MNGGFFSTLLSSPAAPFSVATLREQGHEAVRPARFGEVLLEAGFGEEPNQGNEVQQ